MVWRWVGKLKSSVPLLSIVIIIGIINIINMLLIKPLLVKLAIGAGTHIITENRQQRKMLESDAAMLNAQKMANGEIEYQAGVRQSNDNSWKDEYLVVFLSHYPVILLIWRVSLVKTQIYNRNCICSLSSLTIWAEVLVPDALCKFVASIYGLKGVDILREKID